MALDCRLLFPRRPGTEDAFDRWERQIILKKGDFTKVGLTVHVPVSRCVRNYYFSLACCRKIRRDSSWSVPSNLPWKHKVWPLSSQVSHLWALPTWSCWFPRTSRAMVIAFAQTQSSRLEMELSQPWSYSETTQQTQPRASKTDGRNSSWIISSWILGTMLVDALQRHRLRDKAMLDRPSLNRQF